MVRLQAIPQKIEWQLTAATSAAKDVARRGRATSSGFRTVRTGLTSNAMAAEGEGGGKTRGDQGENGEEMHLDVAFRLLF